MLVQVLLWVSWTKWRVILSLTGPVYHAEAVLKNFGRQNRYTSEIACGEDCSAYLDPSQYLENFLLWNQVVDWQRHSYNGSCLEILWMVGSTYKIAVSPSAIRSASSSWSAPESFRSHACFPSHDFSWFVRPCEFLSSWQNLQTAVDDFRLLFLLVVDLDGAMKDEGGVTMRRTL